MFKNILYVFCSILIFNNAVWASAPSQPVKAFNQAVIHLNTSKNAKQFVKKLFPKRKDLQAKLLSYFPNPQVPLPKATLEGQTVYIEQEGSKASLGYVGKKGSNYHFSINGQELVVNSRATMDSIYNKIKAKLEAKSYGVLDLLFPSAQAGLLAAISGGIILGLTTFSIHVGQSNCESAAGEFYDLLDEVNTKDNSINLLKIHKCTSSSSSATYRINGEEHNVDMGPELMIDNIKKKDGSTQKITYVIRDNKLIKVIDGKQEVDGMTPIELSKYKERFDALYKLQAELAETKGRWSLGYDCTDNCKGIMSVQVIKRQLERDQREQQGKKPTDSSVK